MTAGNFVDRPFGHALRELGELYPQMVVVDADLQRATETDLFQNRFPDRYIDVGIAEANMVGVSAGLALSGKLALCSTFATFITQRVCDQVAVSVAYCRANVILAGVEAGLASGRNGASHQAVLDLAIMRSMPRMRVFVPCDATETRGILAYLMEHPGPAYVRAPRGKTVVLLDPEQYHFEAGRSTQLREGSDVTIIASGIMVERALNAAELLAKQGIAARVINMSSIKPLDEEAILAAAADTGCIVTAENHSVLGGLGSAVAEVVTSNFPVPVMRIGIRDTFGEVGSPEWLVEKFGLGSQHIAQAAIDAVERKRATRKATVQA
jgi:transketolase